MSVKYRKKFLVELSKLPSSARKEIEAFVFEKFPANPSLQQWENISSLRHDDQYYKALFLEYRIGLQRTQHEVIFERIRHRNDIYKIQS